MPLAEEYRALWDSSNSSPDVFAFLAKRNQQPADEQLRVLLIDQARRWESGDPLTVEEYEQRLPDLCSNPDIKLQLAIGEFQARQASETLANIDAFTSRFSDISDQLKSKLSELSSGNPQEPDLPQTVGHTQQLEPTRTFDRQGQADPLDATENFGERLQRNRLKTTKPSVSEPTTGNPQVGRYRLQRVLGEGAFGRVYLAYDEELQRQVAIKVATQERFEKPQYAEQYLAKARTIASLNHPNVVPVYDMGRTDDGSIYVVSKLIVGQTLADRIRRDRPSHDETAKLLATIAGALHHAHELRLIHRDVRPGNILLEGPQATPYIADFGLAIREEDCLNDRRLAGTPAYISPEQMRGESHRLDGRSDIFSLGVVLYELLTGNKPFQAQTAHELFHQVISADPRPPRECDESIPVELERICLKALYKQASDRYSTAAELADDLLHWNELRQETKDLQIVPKGLRSFDAEDADFFLDLLPGPRSRHGLPESIQFWKTRIEETDPDKTFSVGLIYGPSGCGKSSLVKAGLLPRLSPEVTVIYVEVTPDETETHILSGLRRSVPDLPDSLSLMETFSLLRRTEGRKVVIVLDQFEQWLQSNQAEQATELVAALRQADGEHLQAVAMIRDDFAMAAARFMDALDIPIVQGDNFATVDLFDLAHAEKVLVKFGQAFGKLPRSGKLSDDEQSFVHSVASGLATDGQVVSVRLALFAEMVKGKSWSPSTLDEVGGTEGIGVQFLEETFSSATAHSQHRLHQAAARKVLKALLPEVGSDIKGQMRSRDELLHAAGYQNEPSDFNNLLQILDGEVRLITPTDAKGFQTESGGDPNSIFYQLTHDYLVPSLRDWLTRKQQETRRGRAELKLAERSALWNAGPENRHLPSLLEWASIRSLTEKNEWTEPQQAMMRRAGRVISLSTALTGIAVVLTACAGLVISGRIEERQNADYAQDLVESLPSANTADVEDLIRELSEYEQWATSLIKDIVADVDADPTERLHARLFLVKHDSSQVEPVFRQLLSASPEDVPVLIKFLNSHKEQLEKQLWDTLQNGSYRECVRAAAALARFDQTNASWKQAGDEVVTALLSLPASESDAWIEMLTPVGESLAAPLERRFRDGGQQLSSDERSVIATALSAFLADDPEALTALMLIADNDREFQPFLSALRNHTKSVIPELRALVQKSPPEKIEVVQGIPDPGPDERDAFWKMQANAAICLYEMGERESVWPLFEKTPDPSLRSFIIDRLARLGADPAALAAKIQHESDPARRYAMLLGLGQYDVQKMSREQREAYVDLLATTYPNDPDPGVHSAAGWGLRNWHQSEPADAIDSGMRAAGGQKKDWFVNSQGQTFAVIQGPVEFTRRYFEENNHLYGDRYVWKPVGLFHDFAMATHEVTLDQFHRFRSDHENDSLAAHPDGPVNDIAWADAVEYCNWLNQQEGIPREQWCYEPNSEGEYAQGMKVAENYMSLTGYRLPSDGELEFMTRAGATTQFAFGEPVELRNRYAGSRSGSLSLDGLGGLQLPNGLGVFSFLANGLELRHDLSGGASQRTSRLRLARTWSPASNDPQWSEITPSVLGPTSSRYSPYVSSVSSFNESKFQYVTSEMLDDFSNPSLKPFWSTRTFMAESEGAIDGASFSQENGVIRITHAGLAENLQNLELFTAQTIPTTDFEVSVNFRMPSGNGSAWLCVRDPSLQDGHFCGVYFDGETKEYRVWRRSDEGRVGVAGGIPSPFDDERTNWHKLTIRYDATMKLFQAKIDQQVLPSRDFCEIFRTREIEICLRLQKTEGSGSDVAEVEFDDFRLRRPPNSTGGPDPKELTGELIADDFSSAELEPMWKTATLTSGENSDIEGASIVQTDGGVTMTCPPPVGDDTLELMCFTRQIPVTDFEASIDFRMPSGYARAGLIAREPGPEGKQIFRVYFNNTTKQFRIWRRTDDGVGQALAALKYVDVPERERKFWQTLTLQYYALTETMRAKADHHPLVHASGFRAKEIELCFGLQKVPRSGSEPAQIEFDSFRVRLGANSAGRK